MFVRPFLEETGSCPSYLIGCGTHERLAVVDAHDGLVDDDVATAERLGAPIVAVFETHVQADHVSGLPALVELTGATRTCRWAASSSTTSRFAAGPVAGVRLQPALARPAERKPNPQPTEVL